jgi:hypothetical protein
MKAKHVNFFSAFIMLSLLLVNNIVLSQPANNGVRVGVYYFDGWNSMSDFHITPSLVHEFPQRESKWGWITSTPRAMKEQIDLAADAGITFFSFCWYYHDSQSYSTDPVNHAVQLFMSSPNNNRIKFNILVTNAGRYEIGPSEWSTLESLWIPILKNPQYLILMGKPYLTFYDVKTLIKNFGSPQAVKAALDKFRTLAASEGLGGVTIGACVGPNPPDLAAAQACGFDVFTGYNYHGSGFYPRPQDANPTPFPKQAIPISSLLNSDTLVWNVIIHHVSQPYVPLVTLNWDPRPWDDATHHYKTAPYFVGYSEKSVYESVKSAEHWVQNHADRDPAKIAILYAWNEYGEGAWLTPSANDKLRLLEGLKRALLNQ